MISTTHPLSIPNDELFLVVRSDLSPYTRHLRRCDHAMILRCTQGSAAMAVNRHSGELQPQTVVFIPPGSVVMLECSSPDFQVTCCILPRNMFFEVGFHLGAGFFKTLQSFPFWDAERYTAREWGLWFDLMERTYIDRDHTFRQTIVRNRIQNLLLDLYDTICRERHMQPAGSSGRQMELLHRFISLIHDHCSTQRNVVFYADKLCISTRYLSAIVHRLTDQSAKEMIDRIASMKIKILLQTTQLPIQEIASRMHFPDQSNLGSYFKKHTGMTPKSVRMLNR